MLCVCVGFVVVVFGSSLAVFVELFSIIILLSCAISSFAFMICMVVGC